MLLNSLLPIIVVFSISPLINSKVINPIPANYVFIVAIFLMLTFNYKNLKFSSPKLIFLVILFFASAILSLFWMEAKLVMLPIYFVLGYLGVSIMTNEDKIIFVKYMTNILLILLAGALVGFIYAVNGGEALVEFDNPDGRPNFLYLTTLSNAVIGSFIRPSGLFDEPGTFSFFICFIAAARHALGLSSCKTWILLFGGLITFSLAHLIYLIFHALSEKIFSKSVLMVGIFISIFISFILLDPIIFEAADLLVFSRLAFDGGEFAGDNRTSLFENAFNNLNLQSVIFGVDSKCITDYQICRDRYGMMGENPLGPVAMFGILGSISYYYLTLSLFINGIKIKRNLIFFGLALLLLQRPYVMSFGYAFLILFLYGLSGGKKSEKRINYD